MNYFNQYISSLFRGKQFYFFRAGKLQLIQECFTIIVKMHGFKLDPQDFFFSRSLIGYPFFKIIAPSHPTPHKLNNRPFTYLNSGSNRFAVVLRSLHKGTGLQLL